MSNEEKIIDKIQKLLNLSKKNPNENEAIAAALKAQQLMSEHGISMHQLDENSSSKQIVKLMHHPTITPVMRKWKYQLARIISKNFRCKDYIHGKNVVFMGYESDAKIALEVFSYLYDNGNRLAYRYYSECRKNNIPTKNRMNTYLTGFMAGICVKLDKQCTALMLTIPQEVEGAYNQAMEGCSTIDSSIRTLGYDNQAFQDGFYDGRNIADARSLGNSAMQ